MNVLWIFWKGFSIPVIFYEATCLEKDTLHVIPSIVLYKRKEENS